MLWLTVRRCSQRPLFTQTWVAVLVALLPLQFGLNWRLTLVDCCASLEIDICVPALTPTHPADAEGVKEGINKGDTAVRENKPRENNLDFMYASLELLTSCCSCGTVSTISAIRATAYSAVLDYSSAVTNVLCCARISQTPETPF